MKPLITIITVCFNSEKHIEQTIKSVLTQTYSNIEYIIVDGQSTDDTLAIIKKYAKNYPNIIRHISEQDTGIYNAMNKGICMAKGELIGIINSDDWYELTAIEIVANAYEKYGPAVYHGFQRTIKDNNELRIIRTNSNMIRQTMIEHPTCFIPASIYTKYGSFNEKYKFVGDYDLMIRLKASNVSFVPIDDIIANFRMGGASDTKEAELEHMKYWNTIGVISDQELKIRIAIIKLHVTVSKTKKHIKKVVDRFLEL